MAADEKLATGREIRKALARVARTQAKFWDAMSAFERLTDVALATANDFTGYTHPTNEDVEFVCEEYQDGDGIL